MNKVSSKTSPKPFLKWVGGKGQLLEQLNSLFPKEFNTYYEPFVGGGAVFFSLNPKKAHINDINESLINVYKYIRDDADLIISELKKLENKFLKKDNEQRKIFYYAIREKYNTLKHDDIKRSLYFLFLNKTSFNGMYRENSQGGFNVPMGNYKHPRIVNVENIQQVSETLKKTKITTGSFIEVVSKAKKGDFVYFDPPYYPLDGTSSFTSYHSESFGENEQILLRDTFVELDKRGVLVMLSNSYTNFIKELYKGYKQTPVQASRFINAKASGRGKIKEIVITNY